MRARSWTTVGKGIEVLKLWESTGPKWPQIAVLLLSRDEYKAFLKNPKNYLNSFKIFGKTPTKKVSRCRLASVKPHNPPSTYAVIVEHDWNCTSVAMSSSKVTL
jgi:hypothetical protein